MIVRRLPGAVPPWFITRVISLAGRGAGDALSCSEHSKPLLEPSG
jgi:hypothetical protein